MNIHVHSIYHKYAQRKAQLARKGRNGWSKSFMAMKEEKVGPLSLVILVPKILTKIMTKQMFLEDLVVYICKGYI